MKNIFMSVCFILVSGCAAKGPVFSVHESAEISNSHVFIYRVYDFFGGAAAPYIYVNSEYKDELKTGGYLHYILPPGEYQFFIGSKPGDGANWAPRRVEFNVKIDVGEKQYYRMLKDDSEIMPYFIPVGGSILYKSPGISKIGIARVPEESALPEISKTKLSR